MPITKTKSLLGYEVFSKPYMQAMGHTIDWEPDPYDIELIKSVIGDVPDTNFPDKPFKAVPLLADNIADHFEAMAATIVNKPYRLLNKLVRHEHEFDAMPTGDFLELVARPHTDRKPWVAIYADDHGSWHAKPMTLPDSEWLVFDVETFVKGSLDNMPIIATACGYSELLDTYCYYLWTHEALLDPSIEYKPVLVPVGKGKLILAHNIKFDGARIAERYVLEPLANYLVCTQAMHSTVAG